MSFLTRVLLLIIAFTVSATLGYSQEGKTSPAPEPTPPAVEHNPNAWKEYSSQRGRFAIMFPGTPAESDYSYDTAPRAEGRKYILKTTALYRVSYLDFQVQVSNALAMERILRKQFLDGARDVMLGTFKGKLLSDTDISIDGHPGRLIKIAEPDGTMLRTENYVVGTCVYQLEVVTPLELLAPDQGRFDESRATKFLDSFKLAKPIEDDPNAWKTYSSTRGRFSIVFPGTPVEADKSYDTPNGWMDARDYTVTTTAEYSVFYTDFVVDLEQDSTERNKFLDHIRDSVVAAFKAKLISETAISLDAHPGRMMKLSTPDGTVTRVRSYGVGKRLYQITVTTPGELDAPDASRFDELWATKFLDSFKLVKSE